MNSVSAAAVLPEPPLALPGKSANSVGHLAKAAVADARAAGADLPKNAQGFAASQIARGADPASIFISMIVVQIEVEPVTPSTEQAVDAYEAAADASETPSATDITPLQSIGLSEEELALALLQQGGAEETPLL